MGFDKITEVMIADLDAANLKRFEYIKGSIESGKLNSPLVVRKFSDLAFSLARKSMEPEGVVEIAKPLGKIFEKYLESPLISIDTKVRMKSLIGETKLDFVYAGGNHNISSLRLAPYLMANRD